VFFVSVSAWRSASETDSQEAVRLQLREPARPRSQFIRHKDEMTRA